MAAWLRIASISYAGGMGVGTLGTSIIDLECATGFGLYQPNEVAVFIDGQTYYISKQNDEKAYNALLNFIQRTTGQSLV